MRLCTSHGEPGLEIFVHGAGPVGGFPARQNAIASQALIRRHALSNAILARQSDEAIAAGAFHNDVVAVANETVLFTHEQAFADRDGLYAQIRDRLPEAVIIEVPAARVSLEEAIRSYLFNSQLASLPGGGMVLILPGEAQQVPSVMRWLDELIAGNGPIRQLEFMHLRDPCAMAAVRPACVCAWCWRRPNWPRSINASCWTRPGPTH
jgi:succinylarginine dihydrolase